MGDPVVLLHVYFEGGGSQVLLAFAGRIATRAMPAMIVLLVPLCSLLAGGLVVGCFLPAHPQILNSGKIRIPSFMYEESRSFVPAYVCHGFPSLASEKSGMIRRGPRGFDRGANLLSWSAREPTNFLLPGRESNVVHGSHEYFSLMGAS